MVRQWDLIIANPLTQIEQSHAYICPIPYNYQITYVRWCIESDDTNETHDTKHSTSK